MWNGIEMRMWWLCLTVQAPRPVITSVNGTDTSVNVSWTSEDVTVTKCQIRYRRLDTESWTEVRALTWLMSHQHTWTLLSFVWSECDRLCVRVSCWTFVWSLCTSSVIFSPSLNTVWASAAVTSPATGVNGVLKLGSWPQRPVSVNII